MTKECECAAHSAVECCCGAWDEPQRKPLTDERLELIGHADLAINNIYIFNGYGEEVPEGRTPIYAGYKTAHGITKESDMTDEDVEKIIKRNMNLQMNLAGIRADFEEALQRTWVGLPVVTLPLEIK